MLYEDVKVPPEVQARVDRGWEWFVEVTSQAMRDSIDLEDLSMDSISHDVLALAFQSDDSDQVMRRLGINHAEAIRLGMVSPDECEDDDEYFEQLTAAWYRKLADITPAQSSLSPESVAGADAAGLLAMIEGMGR